MVCFEEFFIPSGGKRLPVFLSMIDRQCDDKTTEFSKLDIALDVKEIKETELSIVKFRVFGDWGSSFEVAIQK